MEWRCLLPTSLSRFRAGMECGVVASAACSPIRLQHALHGACFRLRGFLASERVHSSTSPAEAIIRVLKSLQPHPVLSASSLPWALRPVLLSELLWPIRHVRQVPSRPLSLESFGGDPFRLSGAAPLGLQLWKFWLLPRRGPALLLFALSCQASRGVGRLLQLRHRAIEPATLGSDCNQSNECCSMSSLINGTPGTPRNC